MDSEIAANTAKSLGIDIKKILELRKDFPYTLQFEDPRETWHLGPERFKKWPKYMEIYRWFSISLWNPIVRVKSVTVRLLS